MYESQDFRGPAVNKRPRLAEPPPPSRGTPGPGDWTCSSCGNMNFAFRTTCNMRKCGAPKPAENVMRPPPQPSLYDPTQPVYVGGPGGAPPMSSYGSQMGPAPLMFYDQGPPMGGYNPPPSGIMGPGIGGPGYGQTVDYNLGRPPPPDYVQNPSDGLGYYGMAMTPRGPPVYPPDDYSRKRRAGPNGFSEGDWICKECGNTNFAFRTTCNMRKCGAAKPDTSAPSFAAAMKPGARPPEPTPPDGSWTCKSCGNVNYPFRTKCNRRNCGAERPAEKAPSGATKREGEGNGGRTNGK